MDIQGLELEAEKIWQAITRPGDLPENCFCVSLDRIQEGFPALSAGILGAVSQSFDMVAKPTLDAEGRWKGRGACALINWPKIREHFPDDLDARDCFLAVAVHEVAHIVEAPGDYRKMEAPEEWTQERTERFTGLLAAKVEEKETPAVTDLDNQLHSANFYRIAGHLICRARELIGYTLPLQFVMVPKGGAMLYCTLIDEAEKYRDLSFAEILELPPPGHFLKFAEAERIRV